MKKILALVLSVLSALSFTVFGATLAPIQLLNPVGSTAGQAILSTGASTPPAWGNLVPFASPAFTGVPTAPTAAPGTSTTQIATTAFTSAAIANVNAAGQPYFQAVLSTGQSLTANVLTKITFNTKVFDSNNYYDATTNYRFTPLKAGKYKVTLAAQFNAGTAAAQGILWLYKNGAAYAYSNVNSATGSFGAATQVVSLIVNFNGTTDYIEGFITIPVGATLSVQGGSPYASYFEAYYLGP